MWRKGGTCWFATLFSLYYFNVSVRIAGQQHVASEYVTAPPTRREVHSQPVEWEDEGWSSDDDDEMMQIEGAHMHPHAAYRRQHHGHYDDWESGHRSAHYEQQHDLHQHPQHQYKTTRPPQQQQHRYTKPSATSNMQFQMPKLQRYRWLSDYMSHFHELICIVMYVGLIYKIHNDKVAVGISAQTMAAMFISEFVSLVMRYAEIRRYGVWDWSIVHTDFRSTALAFACTVIVWHRSRWHSVTLRQDDHKDAFGMNILSAAYFLVATTVGQVLRTIHEPSNADNKKSSDRVVMMWSSPDGEDVALEVRMAFLYKRDVHFGHLRPLGLMGTVFHRTYWFVLHLCLALPVALLLIMLRQFMGGLTTKTSLAVAYSDAVRAVALIPQLYMYETRKTRAISQQLLVFVVCEGVLRLIALLFWATYPLFHHMSRHGYLSRNYAMVAQILNLVVVGRLVSTLFYPTAQGGGLEKITEMFIPMSTTDRLYDGDELVSQRHSSGQSKNVSSWLRKPRGPQESH